MLTANFDCELEATGFIKWFAVSWLEQRDGKLIECENL